MDNATTTDLKEKLKKLLNCELIEQKEINAGGGNRLFCLTTNKDKLLLKLYVQRDRDSLPKEFRTINFLNRKNFIDTPRAYFKNDDLYYAVYSFEEGITTSITDLTEFDLEKITDFLTSVHNINPAEIDNDFTNATFPCFSFQDYINNINMRFKEFKDYASGENINKKVLKLISDKNPVSFIEKLLGDTVQNYSSEELSEQISKENIRLSPVDFGPHNILFREDNNLVFIDFEHSGLDDPLRTVGEFIVHDQSYALEKSKKEFFLKQYKTKINIDSAFLTRLDLIIQLLAIEWMAIFLQSITPTSLKRKQLAIVNLNVDDHIDKQIKKFENRQKEYAY